MAFYMHIPFHQKTDYLKKQQHRFLFILISNKMLFFILQFIFMYQPILDEVKSKVMVDLFTTDDDHYDDL